MYVFTFVFHSVVIHTGLNRVTAEYRAGPYPYHGYGFRAVYPPGWSFLKKCEFNQSTYKVVWLIKKTLIDQKKRSIPWNQSFIRIR